MALIFKKAQSAEKPLSIDVTSSPGNVYIRRDVKEVEYFDQNDELKKRWEYSEALITSDEYEEYKNVLIANEINSQENSAAFDNFLKKLDTGVRYTNGHSYKPGYISDYKKIMDDISVAIVLTNLLGGSIEQFKTQKFAVYDETGTVQNMVEMTGLEVINLYIFLYTQKEKYFAEYKLEKELGK